MKVTIPAVKWIPRLAIALASAAALLAASAPGLQAQTIGVSFISDTNTDSSSNIANNFDDAMLPSDMAGVAPFAQTNWNNFGARGAGTFTLTNSVGGTAPIVANWDSGHADSTGTSAGLGTGDGKMMDGFLYSWNPGSAPRDPTGNSAGNSSIGDKPLVYLRGLNSWYKSEGAEGYGIVVYTTGYSFFEIGEYWLESVTGDALTSNMVSGADLTPHYFTRDTSAFLGTYLQATSTDINNPTTAGNYASFTGLTNDAVLIRVYSTGYSAGMNGFQLVPIFPAAPTPTAPTISPSNTVFAGQSVTLTEVATGDPFHPQLFYQWQKDNNGDGIVTHNIPNETNSTYSFTPTNAAAAYTINYQVIVTNSSGPSTSSIVTLTVNPATAPFITQDTTPGAGNGVRGVFAYVGGSISFSAAFGGTPAHYLWQSNSVDILGATNTTLTLNNLQLASSASYRLTATNTVDGIASTPSALTVLADPAAPTSATAYPFDVFTNGPVAYWRFNETADNVNNSIQAYDYSGHNLNATYGTGATDNQPGPQSPTFVGFEASNVGVTLVNNLPNSSLIAPALNLRTNTVTITAWINPTTETAFNGLLTWVNGSDKAGFGFGSTVNGNSMAELGYVWSTNNPATVNFHSGLFPLANQWSFVALTITPTNSTIYLYYVDGGTGITNLLKSVQTINNLSEPFSGGTTWIGSDTSAARNFNGTLDEVAVFNKSLSEAQVQDLFLKSLGAVGVKPVLSDPVATPSVPVYSGQNVQLVVSNVSGTVPITLQWQASPDASTWTNINGATTSSLIVNPLFVGNVFYRLTAQNTAGTGASLQAEVTFNALPATPAGLWTLNYAITNNIINFATGGGIGHYAGRGILGAGSFWNVMPDNAGAFGFLGRVDSVSDLRDDGVTHSGIYCTILNGSGFASETVPIPTNNVVALLGQFMNLNAATNALQFHGLPDGTYNLALYGCDGTFGDRGTTFIVHDALNGDQTASTVNQSPITPLQQGVNFVVFSNVHVSGGTLNVGVQANTPLPTHDPNTEADVNAFQIQLVSLDVVQPPVALTESFNGSNLTLNWSQGILQSSTNLLGPWTSIFTSSPATVPTTNSMQFYRVQVK